MGRSSFAEREDRWNRSIASPPRFVSEDKFRNRLVSRSNHSPHQRRKAIEGPRPLDCGLSSAYDALVSYTFIQGVSRMSYGRLLLILFILTNVSMGFSQTLA